jgi:hypothetical protein
MAKRVDLAHRILDAIVYSIGKTVTDTFATAAEIFVDEAGRNFLHYVKEKEGVDLLRDTPLDTIRAIYAYFTERGFFEEATAEKRGEHIVIIERGPAHGGALRHMAKDPAVKTMYCPACVLVKHALREHHNMVVDEVSTKFEDPASVRYELKLSRWETKEPEAAFVYQ